MHLVLLDRWNDLGSPLHRLDPRSKIFAVLAVVLFLMLSTAGLALKLSAVALLLTAAISLSRVPLLYCLKRALVVLPFSLLALLGALAANRLGPEFPGGLKPAGAAAIIAKSYLSALGVLLLAATTRLPDLLKGLAALRVPWAFLMIVQFLYRYLFVLSEEAQHMSYARRSRSGQRRWALARSLPGMLAGLFARSYARAERIHRAMLARGFTGLLPAPAALRWGAAESLFVAATFAYLAAAYLLAAHP